MSERNGRCLRVSGTVVGAGVSLVEIAVAEEVVVTGGELLLLLLLLLLLFLLQLVSVRDAGDRSA